MIEICCYLQENFFAKSYKPFPEKTAKNRHFLSASTAVLFLCSREIPSIAKSFRHPACHSAQGKAACTVKRPFGNI